NRQVVEEMPRDAPGFYFIDIQPEQIEAFDALVLETEGVSKLDRVPMLRGRIVAVNGVSPGDMEIPSEIGWVFRGDRGLTWAETPPDNGEIVEGAWWPADYGGPPLVSLDAEVGELLDLHPGDRLTINILGRDVEVEIANLREIEWGDLQINFVMIFSPGLLEAAPQTHIATVQIAPDKETLLERRVTDAFPNISAIRVKEALESFAQVLRSISVAVTATAGVTVISGVLVLAGAIAAGHHRRIYDSVVLKVLGATRARIGAAFLMEYGLIGAITAIIATIIGCIAGYIVVTEVMESDFAFMAGPVLVTALGATAITLAFGFLGTWRALAQKAAPLLRNE
ncbi:MAG: FtsX-like permease family protein, partial [Rhodovibrionaceae bacterium]